MSSAFPTVHPRQRAPPGRHGRGPWSPMPGGGRIPLEPRNEHPSVDLNDTVARRSSLARIHTFPGFSPRPIVPYDLAREGLESDPLERRVLCPELQEVV